MKKGLILTILIASLLSSACSSTNKIDESYEARNNTETVNAMVEQLDTQSGLEPIEDGSVASAEASSEDVVSGDELELDESQAENYYDDEGHYLFNPHVFVASLYPTYPTEYWDSLYVITTTIQEARHA